MNAYTLMAVNMTCSVDNLPLTVQNQIGNEIIIFNLLLFVIPIQIIDVHFSSYLPNRTLKHQTVDAYRIF